MYRENIVKNALILLWLATSWVHAFSVQVESSQAQPIELSVSALGSVTSEVEATVRSRTEGIVQALNVQAGDEVVQGQVIVQLATEDRQLKLDRASLEARRLDREFRRSQQLFEQQLITKSALDSVESALKAAEAAVADAQKSLDFLRVRAPFDGVVESVMVEVGSVVGAQSALLSLVDPSQLMITVELAQTDIAQVVKGQRASVARAGALPQAATVQRIAPLSSGVSRMFEVDLLPASTAGLRAGMSVSAEIQVEKVQAHFVSPAWLFLDDNGRVGVKTVSTEGVVQFFPVELVRADAQGFYVSGLPESVDIISVGAGFVSAGSTVEVAN